MAKGNKLTLYIVIAMVLGIVVGYIINQNASAEFIKGFEPKIKLLATIFLRLVQMIIAPIVFATLVVGIAKLGDLKTVGRVGGKAMLWFISASLVSLFLGLLLVTITKPGVGVNLSNIDKQGAEELIKKTSDCLLYTSPSPRD